MNATEAREAAADEAREAAAEAQEAENASQANAAETARQRRQQQQQAAQPNKEESLVQYIIWIVVLVALVAFLGWMGYSIYQKASDKPASEGQAEALKAEEPKVTEKSAAPRGTDISADKHELEMLKQSRYYELQLKDLQDSSANLKIGRDAGSVSYNFESKEAQTARLQSEVERLKSERAVLMNEARTVIIDSGAQKCAPPSVNQTFNIYGGRGVEKVESTAPAPAPAKRVPVPSKGTAYGPCCGN